MTKLPVASLPQQDPMKNVLRMKGNYQYSFILYHYSDSLFKNTHPSSFFPQDPTSARRTLPQLNYYYYYYDYYCIIIIIFMQGICNYTPETNHVFRVYVVAAVLYLQFVLRVVLFRPWNKFCTFTLALSAVSVQCQMFFFFCFLDFLLSRCVLL